ncbi:MAG TPA: hypothetical protein VFE33_27015 [Thermoanaerobaculia bacterium]|nr:hypothetical protein [Thermoanaerobaculia bacterium]
MQRTTAPTLEVFVWGLPHREPHHTLLRESLAASDVGPVTWLLHPPGQTAWEHWEESHRRAAASPADLVLLLEDDVIVNRHLRHNVETWGWPNDPDFAAGWLYNPGGYAQEDRWYDDGPNWYGTCAVLVAPDRLRRYVDEALKICQGSGQDWDKDWDNCFCQAILRHGRIRTHYPSLTEHLDELPSAMGNLPSPRSRTSRGTFDRDWRRTP